MKNTRKEFIEADRETKSALTPKQKKILEALRSCSGRYSNRVIARRLGNASHVTVGKVRKMFPEYSCAKTIGRDRKSRPVSNTVSDREMQAAFDHIESVLKKHFCAVGRSEPTMPVGFSEGFWAEFEKHPKFHGVKKIADDLHLKNARKYRAEVERVKLAKAKLTKWIARINALAQPYIE